MSDGQKKISIVLITLDAFSISLLFDNLDSLPNFKKLMENSVVFRNAFSTGPETPFSFPGIIAGVYAFDHGVGIPQHLKTIDQITAEAGYNTAFIGEAIGFITPFFGYGRNIQYSRNLMELSPWPGDRERLAIFMKETGTESHESKAIWNQLRNYLLRKSNSQLRRILATTSRTLRFIQLYTTTNPANYRFKSSLHERFMAEIQEFFRGIFARPQFVWIHSMITHEPYLPPADTRFSESRINYLNYRGLTNLAKGCVEELKSLYIDSMRTTDEFIGKAIAALEATGQLESSIMILTADHGEEFMEEGFHGHQFESCSDSLLNVPLIFYAPKTFKEKVVSAPVSTLDILPTIADLISAETPHTARGISLRSILVDDQSREELESRLWSRPLFSEGWRRDVLDRGNGDTSGERVFVVRMGKLALKLEQKRVRGSTFQEKYVLRDWSKNENLEIQQHQSEFNQLKGFLQEHLSRSAEKAVEQVVYTREEEEELRRRLADLGYT